MLSGLLMISSFAKMKLEYAVVTLVCCSCLVEVNFGADETQGTVTVYMLSFRVSNDESIDLFQ